MHVKRFRSVNAELLKPVLIWELKKKLGYFLVPLKVVQLYLFFWHQTGWRISAELELHLLYMYHRPLYLYRGLAFLWCLFWFYSSFSLPRVSMPLPSSVFLLFVPSSSLFVLGNLISCAFTSFLRLLSFPPALSSPFLRSFASLPLLPLFGHYFLSN